MPQLDLVTFIDQTFYVYLFFILQYIIISVFVLPGIYQSLVIKRFMYETLLNDIQQNVFLLKSSVALVDFLESKFEKKINL